jgi:hypothetical protein
MLDLKAANPTTIIQYTMNGPATSLNDSISLSLNRYDNRSMTINAKMYLGATGKNNVFGIATK